MVVNAAFFTNASLVSSITRGEQIAERLGVPVNKRFEVKDLPKHLVFVKTLPADLACVPESTTIWFDPVDHDGMLPVAVENPRIRVISIGDTADRYLKARLRNPVWKIPEHHCNFENLVRHSDSAAKIVGFCGYKENLDLDVDRLAAELGKAGFSFGCLPMRDGIRREDVTKFYESIDIQITFRLPRMIPGMPPEMKNPLKVINAASFGIPTVGFPEISYEEFPLFVDSYCLEGLVEACRYAASADVHYRESLIKRAQKYHINKIVELYKEILQ